MEIKVIQMIVKPMNATTRYHSNCICKFISLLKKEVNG